MKLKFAKFTDAELREELEARGYAVRGTGDCRYPLSASLERPFPESVKDFKAWALGNIREQLTADMVEWREWPATPARGALFRGLLRVF